MSYYVADRLKRGYHLSFGGFNIGYSITGGFDAANAPFDPAKHKLNMVVSARCGKPDGNGDSGISVRNAR